LSWEKVGPHVGDSACNSLNKSFDLGSCRAGQAAPTCREILPSVRPERVRKLYTFSLAAAQNRRAAVNPHDKRNTADR
jgi:hypothetical protein